LIYSGEYIVKVFFSGEYIVKVFIKNITGEHKVTGIFVRVTYKIPDSCVMAK